MVDKRPRRLPRQPLYRLQNHHRRSPDAAIGQWMNYGLTTFRLRTISTHGKAATGEDRLFRFILPREVRPLRVAVNRGSGQTHDDGPQGRSLGPRPMWAKCLSVGRLAGLPPLGVHRIELPGILPQPVGLSAKASKLDHKSRTGKDVLEEARQWQIPRTLQTPQARMTPDGE